MVSIAHCDRLLVCSYFLYLLHRRSSPNPIQAENDYAPMMTQRQTIGSSEVRVVTFDLDNTLWNTGATIAAANDALAAFMEHKHGITTLQQDPNYKRVEVIMGDLFQANKERYCPAMMMNSSSSSSSDITTTTSSKKMAPVLLTLLRKDAIQYQLQAHNKNGDCSEEDFITWAEEAFAEWMRARHDAIPMHLASSVYPCLEEIASLRTSSGHALVIGAITDGNSDPRLIEGLSSYFDFCVNAEQVGIGKPDKRVYLRAAAEVVRHPSLSDFLLSQSIVINDDDDATETDHDKLEEILGPWWVHIGDDFTKDVVAAKSLNMRSIWARELVMEKFIEENNTNSQSEARFNRSVEDLVKEVSKMQVIKMPVGADDYLSASLLNEFADAVVDRFADLGKVLSAWHEEGRAKASDSPVDRNDNMNILRGVRGRADPDMKAIWPDKEEMPAADTSGNKFCLFCGGQLPAFARFCSGCGEKQP
jgi:FMN phosphatase YigB (HAD superfamily)